MSTWAQGYVSDIAYTSNFYPQTMPAHLAFAALCIGRDPGPLLAPQRILDLGFGMGFGLVLAAAANPRTQFQGVDFLPLHVAHAQGLATAAKLTNVSLREASFQDLAQEASDGQHDVDAIILHGIVSWVSKEARDAIIQIAAKRLRPGGLLYVSYNCLPGQAQMLPIRHLLHEEAKRTAGSTEQQVRAGLELLKGLTQEDAKLFKTNDQATKLLERLGQYGTAYIAHEYFNADWSPFHFADVAALFGRAKLEYVGSATLPENLDPIAVPAAMRQRVARETDPVFRETLRDAAANKDFRRDIFGRGVVALTPAERDVLLAQIRFAMTTVRRHAKNHIPTSLGGVTVKQELCDAVFDLLEEGSADFRSIAALFGDGQANLALETLQLLVHSGQVQPLRIADDPVPAQTLNRLIIAKLLAGRVYEFLASPLLGTGIRVVRQDMFMLAAVFADCEDRDAIVAHVLVSLKQTNTGWAKDGKTLTDPAELEGAVAATVELFLSERLPLWRRLQIL